MAEKMCKVNDTNSRIRRVFAKTGISGAELWLDFVTHDAAAIDTVKSWVAKRKEQERDPSAEEEARGKGTMPLAQKIYPEMEPASGNASRAIISLGGAQPGRSIRVVLANLQLERLTTPQAFDQITTELFTLIGPESDEQGVRVNADGLKYRVAGANTDKGGGRG